jgi:nucleotide-binding universal stress UspA family protein
MISLKRVLVGTDFSHTSEAALTYGVELAESFGASLHVLHVVTEPLHEAYACYAPGAGFLDVVDRFKAEAQKRLELLVAPAAIAAGAVVLETAWGDATESILKYAREHDIDLIVCGTHGRSGWDHFTMGSVAEAVVRRAPCPVLTVHHPEHEFISPDPAVVIREAATA